MSIPSWRTWLCALAVLAVSDSALADGAADSRATTPEEKAFSLKIRKALRASVDGVIAGSDWMFINDEPIRGSESTAIDQASRPFWVSYDAVLTVKPGSARGKRLEAAMAALTEQVGKMAEADFQRRVEAIGAEQNPTIVMTANEGTGVFMLRDEPGAGWQKISVPGAKNAVRATQVQGNTGTDATFLYLGSFAEPRKTDAATVAADGGLKMSANKLVLQNIFIRIQAPHAAADELIKGIDLQSLNALIGH